MIRYETQVHIDRPQHEVYAAMTDPARYHEWTDMVDVRIDHGAPRVGGRGTFRIAGGPIRGDLTMEYLEVHPDRRLVITIEHPWLTWRSVSELIPSGGGTELHYGGEMRLRGLRRLLEPFVAGEVRSGEAAEAERLKAIVEANGRHDGD
jgi:uncharacterized protein YndB with AHSA1/START domain